MDLGERNEACMHICFFICSRRYGAAGSSHRGGPAQQRTAGGLSAGRRRGRADRADEDLAFALAVARLVGGARGGPGLATGTGFKAQAVRCLNGRARAGRAAAVASGGCLLRRATHTMALARPAFVGDLPQADGRCLDFRRAGLAAGRAFASSSPANARPLEQGLLWETHRRDEQPAVRSLSAGFSGCSAARG